MNTLRDWARDNMPDGCELRVAADDGFRVFWSMGDFVYMNNDHVIFQCEQTSAVLGHAFWDKFKVMIAFAEAAEAKRKEVWK